MLKITTCLTGLLVAGCCLAGDGHAQGIQDLFARPQTPANNPAAPTDNEGIQDLFGDKAVGTIPRPSSPRPSTNDRRNVARSQTGSPRTDVVASPSDRLLIPTEDSREQRRLAIAMEIRQKRALRDFEARAARLEAYRWSGSHALRPAWGTDPYNSSRFSRRHTFVIPGYIFR